MIIEPSETIDAWMKALGSKVWVLEPVRSVFLVDGIIAMVEFMENAEGAGYDYEGLLSFLANKEEFLMFKCNDCSVELTLDNFVMCENTGLARCFRCIQPHKRTCPACGDCCG